MRIGYVRTSKKDQNPGLLRRELEAAGCKRVFEESISSRKEDRLQLRAALDYCREDDALVVWKLDRLGHSLRELIDLVNGLQDRGVGFVSLRESLDTATPDGKLVLRVFANIAEFERGLIRERTLAGLEAAGHASARGTQAGHGREEAGARLRDAQEPEDTRARGVRGSGGVALDPLPPPQARRSTR